MIGVWAFEPPIPEEGSAWGQRRSDLVEFAQKEFFNVINNRMSEIKSSKTGMTKAKFSAKYEKGFHKGFFDSLKSESEIENIEQKVMNLILQHHN